MNDPIDANVITFRSIHRQMRIDTRRYVAAVETATEADRAGRLRPLATWAAGFAHELHMHHTIEDTHFFPVMAERLPDVAAVLASLEDDHRVVDEIMQRWTPAARRLADPRHSFEDARDDVLVDAVELRDLLARHLDVEDDLIVPRLADAFTPAQMEEVDRIVKRSMPMKGLSFALPWNVEAFAPADRAELITTAPLALRLLYRLHAGAFRRLVAAAFDGVPQPVLV